MVWFIDKIFRTVFSRCFKHKTFKTKVINLSTQDRTVACTSLSKYTEYIQCVIGKVKKHRITFYLSTLHLNLQIKNTLLARGKNVFVKLLITTTYCLPL